jgi:hypothetical protein
MPMVNISRFSGMTNGAQTALFFELNRERLGSDSVLMA